MKTEEIIRDSKGTVLHEGDIVHNQCGYDLVVTKDTDGSYYGKLICEYGNSCANIPYALCQQDITLIDKPSAEIVNLTDIVLARKMMKYSTGRTKVREQRVNILFLTDGSMVYNYDKFEDISDAIIDAVVNHGEDLDELLDLCYSQRNDNLKKYYMEDIRKYKKQHHIA